MNVEFIARITCECGTVACVPAELVMDYGCGPYARGNGNTVMGCDPPAGWDWTGGRSSRVYQCPACVARRYA